MNEQILQELIGLLAGGASTTQVLNHIIGNSGSASYDGLQSLIAQRNFAFQRDNPAAYSNDALIRHAESFIDTLGFNPATGASQGAAQVLAQAYKFAPDLVGAMIGLPNQQSFYEQITNGSTGINVASGRGPVAMVNPYSARSAYDNAVSMAHRVVDLASPDGKGFDVGFTHGLNMDEIGMVTSRLLSSNIPYSRFQANVNGGAGERLDTSSDEFQDQLKKLGEKFNAAASMLTKLTGSVKESLKLMDELAGGNFLGGSAEQAADTARRAQHLAATVRVTSAMAGVSPQEAYQNMMATQQGLMLRSGIDPRLARLSGYSGTLMRHAADATISFNLWSAANPGASEIEKERAMLSIQARSTQYIGTNGEAAVAIVSAHKNLFSPDELNEIKEAYRRGEPDSVRKLIQSRIGSEAYDDYINDPAAIQAFRDGGDQEFQSEMFQAATEGNMNLTQLAGGRRRLQNNLSRTDAELERVTGDRRFRSKDRREAATKALRDLAQKNGLSEEGAAAMNIDQLKSYLNESGVDTRIVERTEHSAEIERQERDINKNRMSQEEERAAQMQLVSFVDTLKATDAEKEKIKKQIADGGNLNQIYDSLTRRFGVKYDTSILGGKLSSKEAERMLQGLADDKKFWSVEASEDEVRRSIKPRVDVASMFATLGLSEATVSEDFRNAATDKDAMQQYADRAKNFIESGAVTLGDGQTAEGLMAEAREKAFGAVISDVLGDKIGNVAKDDKGKDANGQNAYDRAVARIREKVQAGVENGQSMQEVFSAAMDDLLNDTSFTDAIGEDGVKRLKQLQKDENKEVRNGLNRETVAGKETSLYSEMMANNLTDSYKGLFSADSKDSFLKHANELVNAGVFSQEELDKIDASTLDTKEGREAALKELSPDALNARTNQIAAQLGASPGDANASVMAGLVAQTKKDSLSQEQARNVLMTQGKRLGYTEEQITNVVRGLDDTKAAQTANALSSALNFSEGSFAKKEIDRGREIVKNLRDAINGDRSLDKAFLDNLNSKDEGERNAARAKLQRTIADSGKYQTEDEQKYAVEYISSFARVSYNGMSGVGILMDGNNKDVGSDALFSAAKGAYRKDSASYDILTAVSSILETLGHMYQMMQGLQGIVSH